MYRMGHSKDDFSYAFPTANRNAAPRRPRSEISVTAVERFSATHLRPPPGAKPSNLADLPFDNFEPKPELLKSSWNSLGAKILKFLKLRKKSTRSAPVVTKDSHQPSRRTFHFQDVITHSTQLPAPVAHIDDVTKRYNYDSDEHSGNYASDSQTSCSASVISSSSRNSISSAQSFDSHRSSVTPRSVLSHSGQNTNSQLMANILISITDEEDIPSQSAGEEQGSSEDEVHLVTSLSGPHESAWHQPRDEIFNADLLTARGRQSSSSAKKSSGRHTPRAGIADGRLTSPGPSRRFGTLDLSRIEVHKFR